jgi:ribonucleoside-diphosphate reductase alpha chain
MNKYEQLSHIRKELQRLGEAPDWYTTAAYQLLTENEYLNTAETPKDMFTRMANRASELTTFPIPKNFGYENWNDAFYDITWKGWLSPSTPVLTNLGNDRGHPISCSGTHLEDSIYGFYAARMEVALLTKAGYGTSWNLSNVRPRGSVISKGGTASGIMQSASGAVQDTKDVSQGSRRGNIGQYLNPMHADFDEMYDQIMAEDDGWNAGWILTDSYKELFKTDPDTADTIWKKMMKGRMSKGKGYQFYLDKVNRSRPQMYQDRGLLVSHSNLCGEINLFNDEDHSFTCVLSSMNIARYDEWKDTKAIQIATVFLDAVIEDMLIKARAGKGFEKIIAFTEKSRAIGLGQLGISTYYQMNSWVYGGLESIMFNQSITKELDRETLLASRMLAREVGEPEWMKGYGERFSHRLAFPPTKSTAVHMGGMSEGINPVYANVYEQDTAGGNIYRINPVLLTLMKERDTYTEEVMQRISEAQGSVQGEDWLSVHEKDVFRTAYELNQETIIMMGSQRQKIMTLGGGGQGQSLNLFITPDESEEEISRLHVLAFLDEWLLSLYYVHSLNEELTYKINKSSCVSCEG